MKEQNKITAEPKATNYLTDLAENPAKYIHIGDDGDNIIKELNKNYAGLRMLKQMTLFDRAFKMLTERGHFSRKNAFGEMCRDGYMWVEKHENVQVIVEVRQSYMHIFIKDGYRFHIRALDYKYNYPPLRKQELKGITVAKFKAQGFRPTTNKDFDAFRYGDNRDEAYIFSMVYMPPRRAGDEEIMIVNGVNDRTLFIIDSLSFWEHYLDNPDDIV